MAYNKVIWFNFGLISDRHLKKILIGKSVGERKTKLSNSFYSTESEGGKTPLDIPSPSGPAAKPGTAVNPVDGLLLGSNPLSILQLYGMGQVTAFEGKPESSNLELSLPYFIIALFFQMAKTLSLVTCPGLRISKQTSECPGKFPVVVDITLNILGMKIRNVFTFLGFE